LIHRKRPYICHQACYLDSKLTVKYRRPLAGILGPLCGKKGKEIAGKRGTEGKADERKGKGTEERDK